MQQGGLHLIETRRLSELHTQNQRRCTAITTEDRMHISIYHWNRVRVEVETCYVTGLSIRMVRSHIDRIAVVEQCPHAAASYQSGSASAQISAIYYIW